MALEWPRWHAPGTPPVDTTDWLIVPVPAGELADAGIRLQERINAAPPRTVLRLPAGSFDLSRSLFLKSEMVLRGAGINQTHLIFAGTNTVGRCIAAARWENHQTAPWLPLAADAEPGSVVLHVVASGDPVPAGALIEVEQDNDPAWGLADDWQAGVQGQIVRVAAVAADGAELRLARPLRLPFVRERGARIRRLQTITHVGIEDLSITKRDPDPGYTLDFKFADRCWVRRVSSARTHKAHVNLSFAYECEVRDSDFRESHNYGGGGHGYGVLCNRHTSDCLIESNTFHRLRHAMIVGSGANGNVFGYNSSRDRVPATPGGRMPDISVHGNYVAWNLFEGNVAEEAILPDWYAPAGPGNTLFRNRITREGIAIDVRSDGQIIVGNILPAGRIRIDAQARNVRCEFNAEHQAALAAGIALPTSLYRP